MALKSSREGLRKELVDYLGNIIIDNNLKQNIINSVNDVFVNKSDVLTYEEIQASTDLSGKIASASALSGILRRYHVNVDGQSSTQLDISGLVRDREYLILYTTNNGEFVSGGLLLSTATSNPILSKLSESTQASFVFSIAYPVINIQNNEVYGFDIYITIIG